MTKTKCRGLFALIRVETRFYGNAKRNSSHTRSQKKKNRIKDDNNNNNNNNRMYT